MGVAYSVSNITGGNDNLFTAQNEIMVRNSNCNYIKDYGIMSITAK